MIKFENPERVNIDETLKKYPDQFILMADTVIDVEEGFLLAVCPLEESIELFNMRDAIYQQMKSHTTKYITASVLRCEPSVPEYEIEDLEY